MKKELLGLAAIIFIGVGGLRAQKDTTHNRQHRIIEKRMNGGKPEKMVIVIDGGKMTVNGEEIKGLDSLTMGNGNFKFDLNDMQAFAPQMQEMFKNFGPQMQNGMKGFNFNTRSNKAMLGVNVQKDEKGAKITEIVKESGAEKAGLKTEDVITAINADKITDGDVLVKTIGKYKADDIVDVTVLRSGKEKKFKATLGQNEDIAINNFNWNSDDFKMPGMPGAGPRAFNFNRDDFGGFGGAAERPKFGFNIKDNENGDGVVVNEVKDDTNASKAGLKEADIVTEAAGTAVKNVDELKRVLAENRDKSEISIKVLRNGKAQNLTLKVPKKIKTAEL